MKVKLNVDVILNNKSIYSEGSKTVWSSNSVKYIKEREDEIFTIKRVHSKEYLYPVELVGFSYALWYDEVIPTDLLKRIN